MAKLKVNERHLALAKQAWAHTNSQLPFLKASEAHALIAKTRKAIRRLNRTGRISAVHLKGGVR